MLLSVCWADEYIALVKLQFTGMSLVIKWSDVAGHENLCRPVRDHLKAHFLSDRIKLFKHLQSCQKHCLRTEWT